MYFRTAWGRASAFGFYVITLLLTALIGGVAGWIGVSILGLSFQNSLILANGPIILLSVTVGFVVLQQKGHLDHFGYWCLILIAGILAFFTGGILGMVPLAFLTTREPTPEKQWEINEGDWQREKDVPLDRL